MSPIAIFAGFLTVLVGLADLVFSFLGALAVGLQFHIPVLYFMPVFFTIFFSVALVLDQLAGGMLRRMWWGRNE